MNKGAKENHVATQGSPGCTELESMLVETLHYTMCHVWHLRKDWQASTYSPVSVSFLSRRAGRTESSQDCGEAGFRDRADHHFRGFWGGVLRGACFVGSTREASLLSTLRSQTCVLFISNNY